MVFDAMGEGGAAYIMADGELLHQVSVKSMDFASGITQIDDKTLDIYIIKFTTMAGDEHELVFQWGPAMEMIVMLKQWLDGLHDTGRLDGYDEHTT